ncbi:MAG: DUF4440 domain-containing protein [Acidimicrobiia bacterium]
MPNVENEMELTSADLEQFRELEEGLWRSETRFDRDWLDGVLTDDFSEFCRFGHVYDRDDLINSPKQEVEVDFPFSDFAAELLAPDVALVTYQNEVTYKGSTQRARRSSIWVRAEEDWRLKFQQATTLADA